MIVVSLTGDPTEDLRRAAFSINFSPVFLPVSVIGAEDATIAAGGTKDFGGFVFPRIDLRGFLPDAQLVVEAAGWIDAKDGNNATVELRYGEDVTGTADLLGRQLVSGAGYQKVTVGPFYVFAPGPAPREDIADIFLRVTKAGGGLGVAVKRWCVWATLLKGKS
ncbi:MAG: hypothetical protein L3K06_06880 [Thermoplasmata archaeon]|nr:hypothetical protein [Thermoplasmata archaeon]